MSKAPPRSSWPSPPATPNSEADSDATTLLASDLSPTNKSIDDQYAALSRTSHGLHAKSSTFDENVSFVENVEPSPHLTQHQTELPLLTTTNALPVEEDERATGARVEPPHPKPTSKPEPVSWMSLPRKDQLAILTLARLSEPLTQTSLQSYMFYQLRSFAPDASDSTISYQAGLLQAAFTGAQFCTAIMWGRMADSERMGRKKVILIGLLGTAIGAVGFGFSRSFAVALCWRFLGGALNGNIGVMRTMISEIIREKKFQSRAFLLLPMTFNIGVIIGPILGGILANPIASYPHMFGPDSTFGGTEGVWWMKQWPYALPNLVSAVFLVCAATALMLGLEESLEALRDKPDYGIRLSRWIARTFFRKTNTHEYTAVSNNESGDIEMIPSPSPRDTSRPKIRRKLPFRRIWTRNVLFTFLAHGLLSCHVGTFNSLFFVFMSTPRYTPSSVSGMNGTDPNESLHLTPDYQPHLPFSFTGGLALPPPKIGTALAILGVIGISLQILLYPRLSFRLGTVFSYRLALCLFPLAYTLVPYLAVVPSSSFAPAPAAGALLWVALTIVLFVQVLARTFALPSAAILINNASPHPSVLGTIHGMGQSVSSAMRTLGPIIISWLYGVGLSKGFVGLAWWCMAGVAVVGAIAGCWVREGDGHEIWLEGEEEGEVASKANRSPGTGFL